MTDNSDIPDFQSLMVPVLKIGQEGTVNSQAAISRISQVFGLSEEQRSRMLSSGRQPVINNRVHWAITYLAKAGALRRPMRGHFETTERGAELLSSSPAAIGIKHLERFEEFKDFREGNSVGRISGVGIGDDRTPETPEERMAAAERELHVELKDVLLAQVMEMSPAFFERLVIDLITSMGYGGDWKDAAKQLGRTGDGGIDGTIDEDVLGLDRVYLQAKRYNPDNTIGRPDIQQFAGALLGEAATKGVYVATCSISQPARDFARNAPQRIVLIDGNELTDLMIRHDVGTRLETTFTVKRLDRDYFSEEIT